jgi:hypothetical protein
VALRLEERTQPSSPSFIVSQANIEIAGPKPGGAASGVFVGMESLVCLASGTQKNRAEDRVSVWVCPDTAYGSGACWRGKLTNSSHAISTG